MRRAAPVGILVGDTVAVTLLIAHTLDEYLVKEFQKLITPTREQLLEIAVKYEADANARKGMHSQTAGGDSNPSANRAQSNSNGRQQKYQGGNKDNYVRVRAHFKKLEAEGKCNRCAEPLGSAGLDGHKASCKAKGKSCSYCLSKNMGPGQGQRATS